MVSDLHVAKSQLLCLFGRSLWIGQFCVISPNTVLAKQLWVLTTLNCTFAPQWLVAMPRLLHSLMTESWCMMCVRKTYLYPSITCLQRKISRWCTLDCILIPLLAQMLHVSNSNWYSLSLTGEFHRNPPWSLFRAFIFCLCIDASKSLVKLVTLSAPESCTHLHCGQDSSNAIITSICCCRFDSWLLFVFVFDCYWHWWW